MVHVVSFINPMLRIVSLIAIVYVGGEMLFALPSLMPIVSNTAVTGIVFSGVVLLRETVDYGFCGCVERWGLELR